MSHNPIHEWLDMAFRTIGGEKGAYNDYKNEQDHERGLRERARARRQGSRGRSPSNEPIYLRGRSVSRSREIPLPYATVYPRDRSPPGTSSYSRGPSTPGSSSYTRDPPPPGTSLPPQAPIPQFRVSGSGHLPENSRHHGQSSHRFSSQSGDSFMPGALNSPGSSGGPYMSGGLNPHGSTASPVLGSVNSHQRAAPPTPQYSISSASSGRESPKANTSVQGQRLIGWSQPSPSSSTQRLNAVKPASNTSSHRKQGPQDTQQGPQNQPIVSYSQRASGSASRPRSESHSSHSTTNVPTAHGPTGRVPTAQTPLGDMTRSYLEGMVPNSEAESFRRRYKKKHGTK